jgi:hypothetical protein
MATLKKFRLALSLRYYIFFSHIATSHLIKPKYTMSQISTAKQNNNDSVDVYDEDGIHMFTLSGELHGFTSTSVSIKNNNGSVDVYDEDGIHKFTV